MAYDLELGNRIRALIGNDPNIVEKPMFGGLAFLVNGNMSVAASSKGGLLLRVEPAQTMALAKKPNAKPFEMRGKPMEGWLRVDPAGVTTDKDLAPWVKLSVAYARSLPAKQAGAAKKTGGAAKTTRGAANKIGGAAKLRTAKPPANKKSTASRRASGKEGAVAKRR